MFFVASFSLAPKASTVVTSYSVQAQLQLSQICSADCLWMKTTSAPTMTILENICRPRSWRTYCAATE